MSTTAPPTPTELWADHPFVRKAFAETDDLLGALERLLEISTEVEIRYPSVPFATVLRAASHPLDHVTIRETMAHAGVDQVWIEAALGPLHDDARRVSKDQYTEDDFALVARRVPPAVMVRDYGMSETRATELSRIHRPLTEVERGAIAEFERSGGHVDQSELARRCGVSRRTVRTAFRKVRYQRWLEASRVRALTS